MGYAPKLRKHLSLAVRVSGFLCIVGLHFAFLWVLKPKAGEIQGYHLTGCWGFRSAASAADGGSEFLMPSAEAVDKPNALSPKP